jgi:hypothetical protein
VGMVGINLKTVGINSKTVGISSETVGKNLMRNLLIGIFCNI